MKKQGSNTHIVDLIVYTLVLAGQLLSFEALGAVDSGGGATGGGDVACAAKIQRVRDDLLSWINNSQTELAAMKLQIPEAEYKSKMNLQFVTAHVACTDEQTETIDPVKVDGIAKTCRFDKFDCDSFLAKIDDFAKSLPQTVFQNAKSSCQPHENKSYVTCDYKKIVQPNGQLAITENDLYRLVHHEYAGLADIEPASSDQSTYIYSNRLTVYLGPEVQQVLHVRPVRPVYAGPHTSGKVDFRCVNPVEVKLDQNIGMRFCEIPAAANVLIGKDNGVADQAPVIPRSFKSFQMAQFTVTQQQFKVVVGLQPWRDEEGDLKPRAVQGNNIPATYVSIDQARRFARLLSYLDPSADYRLPTEAEWEYAARAGSYENYYWGDVFDQSNVYSYGTMRIFGVHPQDVTTCPRQNSYDPSYCANNFGLMHMSGNVWQLTEDSYYPNYNRASTNGHVPYKSSGHNPVVRGGGYGDYNEILQSAYRGRPPNFGDPRDTRDWDSIGFRLVRIAK